MLDPPRCSALNTLRLRVASLYLDLNCGINLREIFCLLFDIRLYRKGLFSILPGCTDEHLVSTLEYLFFVFLRILRPNEPTAPIKKEMAGLGRIRRSYTAGECFCTIHEHEKPRA